MLEVTGSAQSGKAPDHCHEARKTGKRVGIAAAGQSLETEFVGV
jgi:hypothetical protein